VIALDAARYHGANRGSDVVDPLIGSLPCAVARGRAELDTAAQRDTRIKLSVVSRGNYRSGQLIEIRDSAQGAAWRGKIVSVQYRLIDGPECDIEVIRHESD